MGPVLPLLAILLMVTACARPPRQATVGQRNDPPLTRSATAPPERPPQAVAPVQAGPYCTLALELPDALVDCTFEECPEELLTQLLLSKELAVESGADGTLGLVERRAQPPLARRLAAFTKSSDNWVLQVDEPSSVAPCSGLPQAGTEAPVVGLAVRRKMSDEVVRTRP